MCFGVGQSIFEAKSCSIFQLFKSYRHGRHSCIDDICHTYVGQENIIYTTTFSNSLSYHLIHAINPTNVTMQHKTSQYIYAPKLSNF